MTGSWLSLLTATCSIDMGERPAAAARMRTASEMAEHSDHPELSGWCLETEAWQAVTDGQYRRALKLGHTRETLGVLSRVERLVAPLKMPESPEHHYRYDPEKSNAYVATTLSWLGDPGAESIARQVLVQLESPAVGPSRPRRAATARLDLSLALLAGSKPDEASAITMQALTSGRLVPSNLWRAKEVIKAIDARDLPEARELRDAYQSLRPQG